MAQHENETPITETGIGSRPTAESAPFPLAHFLEEIVAEKKRARRWNIFFKSLAVGVIVSGLGLLANLEQDGPLAEKPHVSVVRVEGVIKADENASADNIIELLRKAHKDSGTKALVVRLNTPGGSPVQAGNIYDEIRRLKAEKPDLPIYAVVDDICASGGYYIAAATDQIYVNPASVIGSIGVVMNSFGFVDLMQKLGVERRVMTSGEHKALLDPFIPVDEAGRHHLQVMMDGVHQQFITAVRQGRGARLKETPEMFSGLVWNGQQGVGLGLADAFGDSRLVAEQVVGVEDIVEYGKSEDFLEKVLNTLGRVESLATRLSGGVLFN